MPSVIRPPDCKDPDLTDPCRISRATRSLTLPPGFRNSALARICVNGDESVPDPTIPRDDIVNGFGPQAGRTSQPVSWERLRIRIRGVFPTSPSTPSATAAGSLNLSLGRAAHRFQHRSCNHMVTRWQCQPLLQLRELSAVAGPPVCRGRVAAADESAAPAGPPRRRRSQPAPSRARGPSIHRPPA